MARKGGGIGLYVALLFVATGSCGRLVHPEPSGGSRGNSTGGRGADRRTHHGRLVIGEDPLALKGSERRRNPPPAADEGYQADMGMWCTFNEFFLPTLIKRVPKKVGCDPQGRVLGLWSRDPVMSQSNRS